MGFRERGSIPATTDRATRYRAVLISPEPEAQQERLQRSPKPLVHAATKAARKAYRSAYDAFAKVFLAASDALRGGDWLAEFPRWSFPPALAFARTGEDFLPFR